MSDVLRGKIRNIRDCVARIRAVDPGDAVTLAADLTRQESVLLNVQRACQAAIDLAVRLSIEHGLGVPADSRDAFVRLQRAGRIPPELADRLRRMVGFRNIAVHRYQDLDIAVLRSILDDRIADLLGFADLVERGLARG